MTGDELVLADLVGTATDPATPSSVPGLFGTTDPVEVVAQAVAVADALADVISRRGLYKPIGSSNHVLVEGWQLLGVMLGVTGVCVEVAEVPDGYQAMVEARTADGRVIGRAWALCTREETRWSDADDHALLSMAQTRATAKALKGPLGFVVSLAGYQTTPAEELTTDPPPAPAPAPAPAARRGGLRVNDPDARYIATRATERGWDGDRLRVAIRELAGKDPLVIETRAQAVNAIKLLTVAQGAALMDLIDEVDS